MLVIRVIRISRTQEIELGISDLVLTNSSLKLGAVPCNEARGLVDDVCSEGESQLGSRKYCENAIRKRLEKFVVVAAY